MRLTYAKNDDLIRKRHTREFQAETTQRESFLKRSLHRVGAALGFLVVGGLPLYDCAPPHTQIAPRQIVFDEQKISGQIDRDSSANLDTATSSNSSANGSSVASVAPAHGNRLIPDSSIYFKEPTKFVQFTRTGTLGAQLIAENQILVSFRENASEAEMQRINSWLSEQGSIKCGQIAGLRMLMYQIRPGSDMNSILDHLAAEKPVLTALPNGVCRPALNSNLNMKGDVYNGLWWIDRIRLREAWNVTTGSAVIPVAVVDGGIDVNCGSFQGKTIIYGAKCRLNDKEGTVSYVSQNDPINACTGVRSYRASEHGTAVASILASRGDEGVGGVGVAWQNPLISIDVYGAYADIPAGFPGSTTEADLNSAIVLAIEMGARVVNVSQVPDNGNNPVTLDQTTDFRLHLLPAMIKAYQNNVLVVICAGNSGFKNDDQWLPSGEPASESAYFMSNALIVGGTDDWDDPMCKTDYVLKFDNYDNIIENLKADALNAYKGPFCNLLRRAPYRCQCPSCNDLGGLGGYFTVEGKVVEISAPGYQIAIPDIQKPAGSMKVDISTNGTSIAAPMVAGAAALVMSVHPDYTAEQVKQILLNTAQPGGGCRQIGHGILDVAAALGVTVNPWVKIYDNFPPFLTVLQTKDAGFILAARPAVGSVVNTGPGLPKLANGSLVKTNSNGSILWNYHDDAEFYRFNGGNALETLDGEYVLTGGGLFQSTEDSLERNPNPNGIGCWATKTARTATIENTHDDLVMLKIDSSGNALWKKHWSVPNGSYEVREIQETSTGNLILAGNLKVELMYEKAKGNPISTSQPSMNELIRRLSSVKTDVSANDIFLLKTDVNGNSLWEKRINLGNKIASASSLELAEDGGYLISGYAGSDENHAETVIIKTDNNGEVLWHKAIGNQAYATFRISRLKAGGVITTNSCNGEILNLAPDGTQRWSVAYGAPKDLFYKAVETRDESIIAFGQKSIPDSVEPQIWIVKLDELGAKQWEKTFSVRNYGCPYAVQETRDGGFIFAGASKDNKGALLLKTDKNGNMQY